MLSFASSAVIIYNTEGQVLLACRSKYKQFDPGKWETLGGTIEVGETSEECIRREIREEIGCELNDLTFFKTYLFQGEEVDLISTVYTATISQSPEINREIGQLLWVSESEISHLDFSANCRQRVEDFFASNRTS